MSFSNFDFIEMIDGIKNYANEKLLPLAIQNEIGRQRFEHDREIGRLIPALGEEKARAEVGKFKADKESAERSAKITIEVAIGNRLRGALACHKAGKEVECARLLTLALGTFMSIIGKDDGASELESVAGGYLYEASKAADAKAEAA